MRGRRLPLIVAAALLLHCGSSAAAADDFNDLVSKAPLADSLDALNREHDSCRFIDPATVEAFAHDTLVSPPTRSVGSRPDPNGPDCRYWFSGFRSVDVSVARKGGDQVFAALKGTGTIVDHALGTSGKSMRTLGLEGDWDEIILMPHDGIGALQGDSLVTLSFFGFRPAPEQAVPLMNALYTHLGQPLDLDGAAGIAATTAADRKRPRPRDACALLSATDLARVLGTPMDGPPKPQPLQSDRSGCAWSYRGGGLTRTLIYQVTWRDGYDAFDTACDAIALKNAAAHSIHDLLVAKDSASSASDPEAAPRPPAGSGWDFAILGPGEMAAVRSDVLVWAFAPAAADDQLETLAAMVLAVR